jgi:ureidoglycolate lyase
MTQAIQQIRIQPLTAEAFAPFGEVIACNGNNFFHINDAHTERYHALSMTQTDGGSIGISIFRNIKKTELPCKISMLERHPLGSQAFIPMQGQAFLVVVAPNLNAEQPDLDQIHVFISNGQQGVNYRAGTWHHPLLTLEAPSDFTVIDRIGSGHNCDVYSFTAKVIVHP